MTTNHADEQIPTRLRDLADDLRNRVQSEPDIKAIYQGIGLSYHGLYQFATGRRTTPSIDTLQKLCDYYGIAINVREQNGNGII
ncbi:helix-turn-helix domain-containing protein [Aquamicrobium soli]|uniref:Helix-turn-helix domain-containing protein n=1 Tax=Aquamicrobium soli TaxID=1811518 RepID=A0ABV7K433_9HYPH